MDVLETRRQISLTTARQILPGPLDIQHGGYTYWRHVMGTGGCVWIPMADAHGICHGYESVFVFEGMQVEPEGEASVSKTTRLRPGTFAACRWPACFE